LWDEKIKNYPNNLYDKNAPFDFGRLTKEKVAALMEKTYYERAKGYPCKVIIINKSSLKLSLNLNLLNL